MENLGQYLKSIRESKSITIETVCKELRFTPEQVTLIENNQLGTLGNHGFSRALVYTYIRYLEADVNTALNLFDLSWPPLKQNNFTAKKPIKEKKFLISINLIWIIAICIIVIILGSIIWTSYSKGYLKRPFEKQNIQQDTLVTITPVQAKPVKPDTLRQHMLKVAQANQKQAKKPESKTDTKKVQVKSTAPDTTDYIDEMIFKSKESPFNQRL